jgi:hypothetical protein
LRLVIMLLNEFERLEAGGKRGRPQRSRSHEPPTAPREK